MLLSLQAVRRFITPILPAQAPDCDIFLFYLSCRSFSFNRLHFWSSPSFTFNLQSSLCLKFLPYLEEMQPNSSSFFPPFPWSCFYAWAFLFSVSQDNKTSLIDSIHILFLSFTLIATGLSLKTHTTLKDFFLLSFDSPQEQVTWSQTAVFALWQPQPCSYVVNTHTTCVYQFCFGVLFCLQIQFKP